MTADVTATPPKDASTSLLDLVPGLPSALREGAAIDVTMPGGLSPEEGDGITSSLVVWLGPGGNAGPLAELPGQRRHVLLRNVLQQVADTRTLLRTVFAKLDIGGWLVITVPHQFLRERRMRMPSRLGASGLRFYTPASLLMEVEEALEPSEYRVRVLRDDDTGYDYGTPLQQAPSGHQRIVLVVQRIERPGWTAAMLAEGEPAVSHDPDGPVVSADDGPTRLNVISTTGRAVNSILLLKLDHRGDFQLAEPAMSELRRLFPAARLTLVCGSWNIGHARSLGLFDEVLGLDVFAEDPSTMAAPSRSRVDAQFASLLDGRSFDAAIDLRWFADTRPLLRRVRADHKAGIDPWNAFPWLDIRLDIPSPTIEGRVTQGMFGANRFQSSAGHRTRHTLAFRRHLHLRERPVLVWGPYCDLEPGDYRLEFLLEGHGGPQRIAFDIVSDRASTTWASGLLDFGPGLEVPTVDATFPAGAKGVEFRLFAADRIMRDWLFSGVRFKRRGRMVGLHQQETMHLLVQLVSLRLTDPFSLDVLS